MKKNSKHARIQAVRVVLFPRPSLVLARVLVRVDRAVVPVLVRETWGQFRAVWPVRAESGEAGGIEWRPIAGVEPEIEAEVFAVALAAFEAEMGRPCRPRVAHSTRKARRTRVKPPAPTSKEARGEG
jgi:hypothetical protein